MSFFLITRALKMLVPPSRSYPRSKYREEKGFQQPLANKVFSFFIEDLNLAKMILEIQRISPCPAHGWYEFIVSFSFQPVLLGSRQTLIISALAPCPPQQSRLRS